MWQKPAFFIRNCFQFLQMFLKIKKFDYLQTIFSIRKIYPKDSSWSSHDGSFSLKNIKRGSNGKVKEKFLGENFMKNRVKNLVWNTGIQWLDCESFMWNLWIMTIMAVSMMPGATKIVTFRNIQIEKKFVSNFRMPKEPLRELHPISLNKIIWNHWKTWPFL